MEGLPKVGQTVEFDDPWFYSGKGTVVDVQTMPHWAIKVRVTEITEAGKHFLYKSAWILPGYLTVVEETWTCPACGHEAHMAGWCTFDSRPPCDCNEEGPDGEDV